MGSSFSQWLLCCSYCNKFISSAMMERFNFKSVVSLVDSTHSRKSRELTEIEKNNCFSIYTGSDLNNIFRRKPLKIDLIDLSIHAWKTCKRYKACANSRNALFTR